MDLALPHLSYLTRRGGGRYYLQIRMPPGPTWPALLRLSLHTSDAKVARRNLCNALTWLMPFRDAETVTRQAEEVLDQCRRYVRAGSACTWPDLEDRKRFAVTFATFASEVRHYNVPDEVRLPLLSEWAFFTDMLRRDQVRLYEAGGASWSQQRPEPADVSGDGNRADQVERPRPSPVASPRRGKAKKASALLAEFLADERRARGHDGVRGDVGIYVDFMIALLGDRAIGDYGKDDLDKLGRELPEIPNRTGLPRDAKGSLWDRYRHAKEHGWQGLARLSETTLINRYKSGIDRFLAWAETKNHVNDKIRINVVLSPENLVALPRDSFTDDEVELILNMPSFTGCRSSTDRWTPGNRLIQNHIYWGYIIMLLTGMRTSEVGQLKVEDVLEADGVYFFNMQSFDPSQGRVARKDVRNLKTQNSARSIPLDLLIIDLGFLDRVKKLKDSGEARLFPEWKPYKQKSGKVIWDQPLTKDWQYRRKKLMLERKNISLYSSRHAFGDRIDKAGVAQRIRDRLMGHAPSDAKDRYGAKRPVDPEVAALLQNLETPFIKKMREILVPPYERALAGKMTLDLSRVRS